MIFLSSFTIGIDQTNVEICCSLTSAKIKVQTAGNSSCSFQNDFSHLFLVVVYLVQCHSIQLVAFQDEDTCWI